MEVLYLALDRRLVAARRSYRERIARKRGNLARRRREELAPFLVGKHAERPHLEPVGNLAPGLDGEIEVLGEKRLAVRIFLLDVSSDIAKLGELALVLLESPEPVLPVRRPLLKKRRAERRGPCKAERQQKPTRGHRRRTTEEEHDGKDGQKPHHRDLVVLVGERRKHLDEKDGYEARKREPRDE